MSKGINLAIGPSCFTKCNGCYNHFANSARQNKTVSGADVLDFVESALPLGAESVTLHGGDPLTHPEIFDVVRGVKSLGLVVKVDTVGTAFIEDARIVFYGEGVTQRISMAHFLPYVDRLGIPIDGSTNEIGRMFRRGREHQVDEAFQIVEGARAHGVAVNVNTVVHRGNLDDVAALAARVRRAGVPMIQLFQFQATGPIATHNRDEYDITHDEFQEAADKARLEGGVDLLVDAKPASERDGAYFLVDDSGTAYVPNGAGKIRIGHIVDDRERVLRMVDWHFNNVDGTTLGCALRDASSPIQRDLELPILSV